MQHEEKDQFRLFPGFVVNLFCLSLYDTFFLHEIRVIGVHACMKS